MSAKKFIRDIIYKKINNYFYIINFFKYSKNTQWQGHLKKHKFDSKTGKLAATEEWDAAGLEYTFKEQKIDWTGYLLNMLPWILLLGFWFFMIKRMQGGAGGVGGIFKFGKSKASLWTSDQPRVTFKQVAGCEEAKEELKEVIDFLKNSGLKIIGCSEKAEKAVYDVDLKGPTAIIMGSEEDGISPAYLNLCDNIVKIPMYGSIPSLNVSVSASILMYEFNKQTHG